MILKGLEEIKTMSGYKLWDVMRKSQKAGMMNVFNACYERAKKLNNRTYGRWEEAKAHFEMQTFPQWEAQNKTQVTQILGYHFEIHMEVDETQTIRNHYMSLINPKTNSCVLKWMVKNKEVAF